jgi:hypothetical protein
MNVEMLMEERRRAVAEGGELSLVFVVHSAADAVGLPPDQVRVRADCPPGRAYLVARAALEDPGFCADCAEFDATHDAEGNPL